METWRELLGRGDPDGAWAAFMDRYRGLIVATIRRTLDVPDDLPDVLADVGASLSADGLARLRKYVDREETGARFSTWLVVVVRNLTVDWMRRRSGRRRVTAPESLAPLQREIFRHVFQDGRSHAEAYEVMRSGPAAELSFSGFLRELADTYRLLELSNSRGVLRYVPGPPEMERQPAPHPEAAAMARDAAERLDAALGSLPPETRLAVQLFVVDALPADDVARTLGWPNAKAVYNRVYRALRKVREALEEQGVRPGDL